MKDETTLAAKVEALNEKINELINEQKNINTKIEKIQEFNEITDMRLDVLNNDMKDMIRVILDMYKKIENENNEND